MKKGIILIVMIGLVIFPITTSSAEEPVPTSLEIETHRLINDVRANNEEGIDLQPLELQSTLIDVARKHSQDMMEQGYLFHVDDQGNGPGDRVSEAGVVYDRVGENLYWSEGISEEDVAEEAVNGWVNSPGHYQNIITNFAFTGIGIAHQGETYYITQVFVNADPGHLEDVGRIYDNNELDSITAEENNTGFRMTPQIWTIVIVTIVILIGLDAGRRNKKYYRR